MFRLIVTVRRGSAASLPEASMHYPTVPAARIAAAAVMKHERVLRVAIVRNESPPAFVEWC